MEGSQLRRSMTLSEQLSIEDSPSHKLASPRVAAAGGAEKREAFAAGSSGGSVSSRTLMDIIKEEHGANGGAAPRINWKSFKQRLPLRCAGADASASISDPEVDPLRPNAAAALGRSISRSFPVRNAEMPFPGSTSRRRDIVSEYNHAAAGTAAEDVESDPPSSSGSRGGEEEREGSEGSNPSDTSGTGRAAAVPAAEAQPMRMPLMALLEQADRWGGEGEEEAAAEEEIADDDDEGDGGVMYHGCCVCMIRRKGAAFIPCGHTFCRLCSRELWVNRGNCPLCNGFILEILDIV